MRRIGLPDVEGAHIREETNKRICEEIAIIPSKKLRNKIAGFFTHVRKQGLY